MIKTILIPTILSILALFNFYAGEVSLDLNMPETANAGDEFLVEVTINKGDIEGFARYQQELPVGFKAVARETSNGKFSFEGQKVKIQWMQIPFDREFKISYAIEVGPTVSGEFNFGGKFSYILNNGVQTATISPKTINIIGDETLAGTMAAANTTYSYQNVSLKNIDCIRQKPYLNQDNEIIVNLLINKGDLTGFGKIQEQIPRGYKAISLRSKNSIFTYKNQIIKFLWMNMPREEQFVVSYKLVEETSIPAEQAFLIAGEFSYAENERTKTINIAERNVDLATFKGDELVAQTTTTEPDPIDNTITNTETVQNQNEQTQTDQTTNLVADNTVNQNTVEKEDPKETTTQQTITEPKKDPVNLPVLTSVPMPENGVNYRVQIAAGHKLVKENYFKRLNITDEVQTEIHEGWHKYTIGNFQQYRDARDYRVYVWNNTPIHDAFVAAYNSGIRITVQEALMIANQKWYK